jgi:hypothetical protein
MKASSFVAVTLLSAALTGCQGETPGSTTPGSGVSYTELPQRKTTVSGIVYDPEAFFFSLANWPGDPNEAPPPAFFNGVPHVMRAAPMGAQVSIVGDGTVADTSGPVPPTGTWQVLGVPTSDTTLYMARAEPPEEGAVVIGAPDIFPSPPFEAIPSGKYYPTTALRPILANASSCQLQVAEMLGDVGGLAAVANMMDRPTAPADLVDPSKTGAVVFIWVYAPSPVLDIFNIPSDDSIIMEGVTPNSVLQFAVGWAPKDMGPPGQSPMGYFAIPYSPPPDPPLASPLGYFALVIPAGTEGPVRVNFVDTKQDPNNESGPRPWRIPGVSIPVVPGVSFLRLHAQPGGAPPPVDPSTEPLPEPDTSWMCLPR